ncbi:MAG: HTTM domain-containing protein, partial [Caldilineaceae bacterium]|nr:HTTM domain-containing protein [Caldilineaceae bacterium]
QLFPYTRSPIYKAAVDAWRRPESASPVVAQWTMAAVRLQLALVYLFAGVAKLQADWLFRAMPLKIWLSAHAEFPLIGGLFDHAAMAYAMSWGGLFYDLTIPFLLLHPRTRRLSFVAVIGFHVMTRLLFPIGMFPAIMVGCTLVFFPAEDFARVGRWFKLPARRQTTTLSPGRAQLHPVMAGSLALFFAIQIVLPLRHWLYPGNLLWTEEGFRYAWHVMVAEKTGHVTFYVDDPVRDIEFPVFVTDYLTDAQARQMAYQPDMILEFAHYLQTDLRNQGIPDAAVRAEAYVSLNGRPSQLLIDPTVDLTKETNSIWPKPWILPLADDPPRHQLASFN